MRRVSLVMLCCFFASVSIAQTAVVKQINEMNPPAEALAPLHFLAADELMGRATLRPEIHVAARYISELFKSYGLKQVPGTANYFQQFELRFHSPATSGSVSIDGKSFELKKNLVQARGLAVSLNAPVVYAKFGSAADLADLDVRGKIVVTNMGQNDSTPARMGGAARTAKQKALHDKGALALIERYGHPEAEWAQIREAFHERSISAQDSLIPVLMVHDPGNQLPSLIKGGSMAKVEIVGAHIKSIAAKNVMGWIEGTDPALKDQFLVLSAHYDHVGVAPKPKMEEGKLDSIYNGARDNAIGVTAIINAAKYFAKHPPKRSVLVIAYTGEEMGLLGSRHFASNPPIPLKQLVYNLNIDNANYNDTSRVTVVGLGRTSADEDIKKACSTFGLTAYSDPAPEQNLFDRSDNVSLAAKGIPAPTFSLGFKKFDEVITKRYHQLSDEVGDMDLEYSMKYLKSFIFAAKLIADNAKQPEWIKGDKYEAAWKSLYAKPF